MRIGNIALKNQVILAPMAGITDSPFRRLAVEMGCALVYTEMISAKGTLYNPSQTLKIACFKETERPVGIQLFGSDPVIMAEGAALAAKLEPDLIDINMGCPVRKVISRGEGCALMLDPEKAYVITRSVCEAVDLPVTVKMRKGWSNDRINVVEVARAMQEAGAAAVTIHGRTGEQGYSGTADWSIIAAVKEKVDIPVIGSGDIRQPEDAALMLSETGCDAVMLGRGVLGNLWLIKRTVHFLDTGEILPEPDKNERLDFALKHLALVIKEKGEDIGVREMRKQISWYLKGMPNAAKIRNKVMHAVSRAEVDAILKDAIF